MPDMESVGTAILMTLGLVVVSLMIVGGLVSIVFLYNIFKYQVWHKKHYLFYKFDIAPSDRCNHLKLSTNKVSGIETFFNKALFHQENLSTIYANSGLEFTSLLLLTIF